MRGLRNVVVAAATAVVLTLFFVAPAPAGAQYVDPSGVAGAGAGASPSGSAGGAGGAPLARTGAWQVEEQVAVGAALVAAGGLVVYGVHRRRSIA